jgi:creatinine amidohydrolase
MMFDGEGIARHLEATFGRLQDFGVSTVLLFSGHFAPEQLDMVDAVARTWNARGGDLRVVATAVNRCPSSPLPPDHAGRFETTLLAGIAPELVHLDRLPSLAENPSRDPGGDAYGDHRHDPSHPVHGVFGPDPRTADLTEGPALLRHLGAWLAALAVSVPV